MKRISLNKVMAKLAVEQTPEQVQLGRIDDIRAKMKEYGMDADAADKIVKSAIQKYEKAVKSGEQLLKELAYTLDVAEEIGAAQVAKEARDKMAEVRSNVAMYEKKIADLKAQ